MKVTTTTLAGAFVIEPKVHRDNRGFFWECFQERRYNEMGVKAKFIQDNHSRSCRGVLRGLHYQINHSQTQLVYVSRGKIFDVIVDLRTHSETFGKWYGTYLSGDEPRQIFMPKGFAHGFLVISDTADIHYKVSEYYNPDDEAGILWCDADLNINWPVNNPIVSKRDMEFPVLSAIHESRLPKVGS